MTKSKEPKPSSKELYKPTAFESIRETFDSIAIAFILAFLFRSFQAEAFVIPTGSMALTLMGAHKEVHCPQCNLLYRVGASEESPEGRNEVPLPVVASTCPNCRFRDVYGQEFPPTFNGDRILVTKFPYEFADPQRFDVAVFKNPGKAKQNYIKRVLGLPREEILIYRGDVYARGADATTFMIARKPPDKVVATLQTVYDNDHVIPQIIARGWPERWHRMQPAGDPNAPTGATWQTSADKKSFHAVGKSPVDSWLRYEHIVPDDESWRILSERTLTVDEHRELCRPQLIADFCEYNTNESRDPESHSIKRDAAALGIHWVSDLALECELEFTPGADADAEAILELVEGGKALHCRISPTSGNVELRIEGAPEFHPKAVGVVVGKGPHRLRFANVDDHLLFWVNDKPITFDAPTNFLATNSAPIYEFGTDETGRRRTVTNGRELAGGTNAPLLHNSVPQEQDLRSPVGIAARGVDMVASHLHLKRDLYYVADKGRFDSAVANTLSDYRDNAFEGFDQDGLTSFGVEAKIGAFRRFLSDVKTAPERWRKLGAVTFQLEADQFFVLGDNSPMSLDGRMWARDHYEHYVKRELLIGKALFVYWPHGIETLPGTSIKLPNLPYFGRQYGPNFSAMRLIR